MKKYVIDASVVLYGLLGKDEQSVERIKDLFCEAQKNKIEIWSLALLHFEVANGLRFSIKNNDYNPEIISKFAKLPIKIFTINCNHMKEIVLRSYELNTTVYDTSYHFAAKLIQGIYLTRDKEYYNKAIGWKDIELVYA